jgi:hypothetical protein
MDSRTEASDGKEGITRCQLEEWRKGVKELAVWVANMEGEDRVYCKRWLENMQNNLELAMLLPDFDEKQLRDLLRKDWVCIRQILLGEEVFVKEEVFIRA